MSNPGHRKLFISRGAEDWQKPAGGGAAATSWPALYAKIIASANPLVPMLWMDAGATAWTQGLGYPAYCTANPCDSDGENTDTETTVLLSLPRQASRWTEIGTVVGYIESDGLTGVEPYVVDGHVITGIEADPGLPVLTDALAGEIAETTGPYRLEYLIWPSASEPDDLYGFDTGWDIVPCPNVDGLFMAWAGDPSATYFSYGQHNEATGVDVTPTTSESSAPTWDVQSGSGAVVLGTHTHTVAVQATAENIELPRMCLNMIHWVGLSA